MLRLLTAFILTIGLAPRSDAAEFTVRTSTPAVEIELSGDIDPGDMYKLRSLLAKQDSRVRNRRIFLEGDGGDLATGIALGRYFRTHGIRTFLDSGKKCLSACAIAFLGGAQHDNTNLSFRQKAFNGTLGFHSFTTEDPSVNEGPEDTNSPAFNEKIQKIVFDAQKMAFDLTRYFADVDGDFRIIERMLLLKPGELYYVDNNDALDYCIYVNGPTEKAVNPYRLRYVEGVMLDRLAARCKESVTISR